MHSITTSNLLPYSSTSLQSSLVKKTNHPFLFTLFTNSHHHTTKITTKNLAHPSDHNRNRNESFLVSASGSLEAQPEKQERVLVSAIEAVSDIVREFSGGSLSGEECYQIAEKAPNYVKMLVGSVSELGFDQDSCSFKVRVFEMGIEKGDKGIVPFLESSFGLSLPSAMHLSRLCLSSNQTLSKLVVKVNYLKEMLFSDDGDDEDSGDIGKVARRMMMRLSISVDDDGLQQTLAFFEKTQARRGGLNVLGDKDASFPRLIQSFPRILLLSLETRLKPMVEFLTDVGVPKRNLRNVVLLYPPILFHDVEKDTKPAFVKVKAENKDLGRLLLKYPWILSSSIQKNYMEIHSFFDTKMVPKSSVDLAINSWPHLLGCSIDKLKLMVKQFAELGISNKKLGQVIAKSPQLLLQKPQEIQQVVNFLKESGLDEETVGRVLRRCPEIFATDVDRILRKKIEFLNSIGVSGVCLPYVIKKYPELFVCDVGKALHPRMMYLMEIGLSRNDVASMVSRFSPLLGYSIKEVLRPKSEFLVNTMRKPLSEIVKYPRYYSYSMEKKIEPRFRELRSRNVKCSLKDMLSKNDEEFAAEFMSVEKNPDHVR